MSDGGSRNMLKLLNRWTVVASLAKLTACGYGLDVSSAQNPAASAATNDTIVTAPSPPGAISLAVGHSAAVSGYGGMAIH